MDIEKTFREVIMGEIAGLSSLQGKITLNQMADINQGEKPDRLDDAMDLLQHIRNNWDKEDFDGEEMDRKIDELLGKIR